MKSLWALYDVSAPFQEINHNPELFWSRQLRRRWAGLREYQVGFEHESNGEGGETSRSWNRLYVQPTFNWFFDGWFNDIRLIPKLWWVTPLQYPEDSDGIMRALGAGKVTFEIAQRRRGANAGEQNGWALDVSAGVGTSFDRGFLEGGFAYDPPIKFMPAAYVQAFYGYGETLARSLIRNTQLRVGFRLMEY